MKTAKETGMPPLFLVAKISVSKNKLNWQMINFENQNDQEYMALKSMEEVRQYVLKKGKQDEAKAYTFVNQLKDK